jgi:hypothetical protein
MAPDIENGQIAAYVLSLFSFDKERKWTGLVSSAMSRSAARGRNK